MNIWILILVLATVTSASRTLPLVVSRKGNTNPRVQTVMEILPYTLMAALVFPAALSSVEGSWLASVASLAAAIILAIAKKPLMACVLAAVGVCALILLFV